MIENVGKVRKAAEKVAAEVDQEQALRGTYYKLSTDTVSLVEGLLSKDHELTLKLRSLPSALIGAQTPGGNGSGAPSA